MVWQNTIMTTGLDGMIACHSHLECGQTKVTKSKRNHSVSYLWYKVYQRTFNHVKTPIARVLAYPDYSKVFESYTDTSSN